MGKNWKGHRGTGNKGGGGGGADLASVRGFACVAGTCDSAREREANRELCNLLNDALDDLYPAADESTADDPEASCMDALQAELAAVRSQSVGGTQRIRTINAGVKGFVLARIAVRDACPVRLVAHIFKRVEATRLPCARHLVRIFPLQHTFYPNEEELASAVDLTLQREFGCSSVAGASNDFSGKCTSSLAGTALKSFDGNVLTSSSNDSSLLTKQRLSPTTAATADSVVGVKRCLVSSEESLEEDVKRLKTLPSDDFSAVPASDEVNLPVLSIPTISRRVSTYNLFFNRRNNDKITKQMVLDKIWARAPANLKYNYKIFEDAVVVEVFKNVAGISYVHDFEVSLHDMNIRKFQASFRINTVDQGNQALVAIDIDTVNATTSGSGGN